MKQLSILLLLFFVVSCASIRVNYDYDKEANFGGYKTYNYYADMKTGLTELDTKRFLDVLDKQMQAKGFSLSDTPDFFVDIKSREYQEAQRSSVGVGLGGGGRHMGGGISIGVPVGQSKLHRTMTIDFVDEGKKQLFWQAVSESTFNPNATPENKEAQFNAIIEKVLGQYPPKQ
ncbi:MAG: DUF4136 domain-containing protein [Aestuariibaculum sp.]